MVGVSCLIKNTQLQQDLKDIVEYIAYDRIGRGKDASVASIYNTIRKSGIEVDLQSIGYIYNDVLDKSYGQIMSDQQVNDYMLKSFNDAIRRAALLEQSNSKENQIGEDASERSVVNGILNIFYRSEVPDQSTQSNMLQMQEALWKGIKRRLKIRDSQKPKNDDQWKDILQRALGYETLGTVDLNGRLNSISDLYNAMREELNTALSEVDQQADPAVYERLMDMVNGLEASTYSLLFSGKEARKLLDDMMKEAGFGKTLKNGTSILDWNKLAGEIGSIQDLRDNIETVLFKNGYNQDVIEGVKNSLENEFTELQGRILEKAENELSKRQTPTQRERTNKSDLRRLAELNNLGIFKSSYNKALYNLIGVDDLQQEDLNDLEKIADAASNLYREVDKNYGSEIFASRQFQTLQRYIDSIIARNINNKTKSLKVLAAIKNFLDVYLTGLLSGPLTILENLWSGVKEMFVPTLMGAGINKEDAEIYRRTLADVVTRGQAFGEEVGSFAPRELYVNTLKWKWLGGTAKEKAESLLFALTIPARIGLLGFDSANKVTITNKIFKNSIYQALTQQGMGKEDAKKLMNEALYGQSFQDAKTQAKGMIERTNADLPDKHKIPINNNTITTLANDLVKANLNSNGAMTNDVLEAAYKSSYHVAGYGLGHEANNWFSKQVKGMRNTMQQEEDRLVKDKEWNKLAVHRLKSTFVNNMIVRFAAGASNWLYLRLQSGLGLGLVTGFLGDWNKEIDFESKTKIKQSIKDIQNSRNKIGRALIGTSATAFAYILYYALTDPKDEDDEKKLAELKRRLEELKIKKARDFEGGSEEKAQEVDKITKEIATLEKAVSPMKKIKGDWMKSRLFKKVAPDVLLLHYYLDTEKNAYIGALKYVQNSYGLGNQFSADSKIQEASNLYFKGQTDAANGMLSSIAGDRFGVPLWRAGKDWYKLGKWIGGGKVASDFELPHNFSDGLWGGGMMEDLGFYDKNPSITILPGIGEKKYELFKQKGMSNMSDLKGNWWEETYTDANGEEKYILNATQKIKAKESYEKYKEQK